MKIWEVTYPSDPSPHVEWAATKREAERLAREGEGDFRWVDVPTKKAALIDFLNREWM
jgi:hypothetical protein